MRPTETLMHEHQVILTVLDAAEREIRRMRQTEQVRPEVIERMVDFIRNFADRCHHAKEEDLLFVQMEKRGMSAESGPIAVMLYEHEQGRARVRAVAEALPQAQAGETAAVSTVVENLEAYVGLLRQHIDKEDQILYPMANRILTPADQEHLTQAFGRVEQEEIGAGVHEHYHKMAHELAEETR